mgnify:CR=1 FL=1
MLVLVALLSLTALERERENYLAAAHARNRTLINAMEAQMQGHLSTLRALAASAALERGDLQAFDAEGRVVYTRWLDVAGVNEVKLGADLRRQTEVADLLQ